MRTTILSWLSYTLLCLSITTAALPLPSNPEVPSSRLEIGPDELPANFFDHIPGLSDIQKFNARKDYHKTLQWFKARVSR